MKFSSIVRYGLASAFSFVLLIGLTAGLHELALLTEEASYAITLLIVMGVNFLSYRYFIFNGSGQSIARQLMLYLVSTLCFRSLEYICFLVLHTWLGTPYLIAIVGITGGSMVAKYVYFGKFVFRETAETQPSPQGLG